MNEVIWPMGMDRDLSTRPFVFNPKGFLVAIVKDDEDAMSARASLEEVGFATKDLRVYTSRQILADHERYLEARSMGRRVVGALTDYRADIELYFGYAREGCAALWIHVPKRHDASRAIRYLSHHGVLHYRYVGQDRDADIHVGELSAS